MPEALGVVILGLLQGITEFLPVSSSGHLALLQMLGVGEGGLSLNVLLHAGTLVATLIYFREDVLKIIKAALPSAIVTSTSVAPSPQHLQSVSERGNCELNQRQEGRRLLQIILLASLPTAIIGLSLRHQIETMTDSPMAVGIGFLITSLLLATTARFPSGSKLCLSWQEALLLGLVQGIAIAPGISRSGATICCLLAMKIHPARAFKLSMLISLPAVGGAFLLECLKAGGSSVLSDGLAWFGAAIAAASGYLALRWLRSLVSLGRFWWFALWVFPLAIATIAMASAYPQRAHSPQLSAPMPDSP